jgi:WD40 repeat protein
MARFLALLQDQEPRPGQEDLRGFEWYFWRNQLRWGHVTLTGHTGPVTSVSFSADGKHLASAGVDGTVQVWDAATGQLAHTLKHTGPGQEDTPMGPASGVGSVAFSADSKRLASAGGDGTVKVWDAATGQLARTLKGYTFVAGSMSFSPDNKCLASVDLPGNVTVRDAATGQEARTLKWHTAAVTSVTFSPDGRHLATSASEDGYGARVWDTATGQEVLTLKGHTNVVGDNILVVLRRFPQWPNSGNFGKGELRRTVTGAVLLPGFVDWTIE